MITMKDQVRVINAAFGHADRLEDFAGSDELRASRALETGEMADDPRVLVDMTKTAFYARMVRWTSWFVDTVTKEPLTVETDMFARTVLKGSKEHVLPELRDTSLPDGLESVSAVLVYEARRRTENGIRTDMMQGGVLPSPVVIEAYNHLLGGNSEGTHVVADALGALFEATAATVPDKTVTRNSLLVARDVKDGMLNSFGIEKIVDAMILVRMKPYAIRQETVDDLRLVFSDPTMEYMMTVAQTSHVRRNDADKMEMIFVALGKLKIDGVQYQRTDMLRAVHAVLPMNKWADKLEVALAMERLMIRLWEKPKSMHTIQERLAHMALTSLSQCQMKDDNDLTDRVGCPLHATGKFGKWYRHIAEPMTNWYLQQRKFSA